MGQTEDLTTNKPLSPSSNSAQSKPNPVIELLGQINVSMSYLDGAPCLALVDTGSQVTTVSEGFYKEHLSSCPLQQIDEILKVEGANGQEVPFLGYLQTNISFPEHTSGLQEKVDA